jgi:FKBP-type peptidyl-prolyl cis-trans isomerase
MTMLGEALRPEMFERLRELESFREYEAKVEARAEAKADAAAKAAVAEAKAAVAEAKAEAEATTIAGNLNEFLVLRGDAPSEHAINSINACHNAGVLSAWLRRAYLGETSAQLFPEPSAI